MKQALVRRLERLEELRAPAHTNYPVEGWGRLGKINAAILICAALREGGEAKKELDAANGSLNPERRAELSKTLEVARAIAATLAKFKLVSEGENHGITG